jgi:3-hydroxy-9,10-secoandrosta-1,3,5(10)-triene-9,17-dione monooxygenase reductase component
MGGPGENDDIELLDASDAEHFRRALGQFATGVVIVSAIDGDEPAGVTCQSFSSLSLDPPLVLFAAAATSTTLPRLRSAGDVCINVLAHDQAGLAGQFARSGTDKWAGVTWHPADNGAPRIDGAAMWCEGSISAVHEGGDHFVVIVAVTGLAAPAAITAPLIFHAGVFTQLVGTVASD